mgnify:FL=1
MRSTRPDESRPQKALKTPHHSTADGSPITSPDGASNRTTSDENTTGIHNLQSTKAGQTKAEKPDSNISPIPSTGPDESTRSTRPQEAPEGIYNPQIQFTPIPVHGKANRTQASERKHQKPESIKRDQDQTRPENINTLGIDGTPERSLDHETLR